MITGIVCHEAMGVDAEEGGKYQSKLRKISE